MAAKMYKTKIALLILFTLTFLSSCRCAKLTVPRILLPYNAGVPTNYTLEVKDGSCYKWSSSRYDIVSVQPLPSEKETESCTTKAMVSSVSRYPERDSAIILAEDERSGQVLRCDVVIDAIHSIEIVTTTRVLFLEDAPEIFEVIAKNDRGDTFSSLAGVAFQWAVDSEMYASDVHGVLRFLKFAESEYKTPPAIQYWEKQNLHGSMILMEGSKTGTAKVTVKPLDLSYKDVKPYDVSLVIVAKLNLKPAHIYLLPGTTIKYYLELIKQGKVYPVSLPSEQYYLDVVDVNVGELDPGTSIFRALNYGSSNIVVKDRYVTDREIGYLPSAIVHVTVPSYMTLSILPGDKWSLQEEKQYFISVNIYDRNSYPVHITKEVNVEVVFPPQYFRVVSSTENGTYHEVYTLTHGSCQVSAKLTGIGRKNQIRKLDIPIAVTQDVIIYEKITVSPPVTLLPWDPVAKPSYSVNLTASGGTGSYLWRSSQRSLAEVDEVTFQNKPSAKVITFGAGEVTIHAIDSHISLFSGSATVSIQNAISLSLKPQEVEVHVNETLSLPMVMHGNRDGEEMMFSDCTQLPLVVDVHEVPKFEYLKDDLPATSSACRTLQLSCFAAGYNRIRVQYKRNTDVLRTSVVVGCYKKLKLSHPTLETVNALGSSLDVLFEGGPKPWPNCKENFYAELSGMEAVARTLLLQNTTDQLENFHSYNAVCTDYGEVDIDLSVGNRPCPTNNHPLNNKASARVICAIPQSVIISTGSSPIPGRTCPASADDMIAVHNQQDVQLEIHVKDNLGRRFFNISSLIVKWSILDESLASLDSAEGFQSALTLKDGYYTITKHYQELHPKGKEGILKVTATMAGYKPEVLQLYNIDSKPELPALISHTLTLNFVEEVEVSPRKLSLFNNPSNKGEINITKGSGHFHIEISDTSKAKVVYFKDSRKLEVVPLDTGSFTVTIYDLCVSMKRAAVAQVHVYGISAILLDVLDKVEIGKVILASVEVLNEDNQNVPTSVFSLMNLQPSSPSDVVSVRLASIPGRDPIRALYQVSGLKLGQTSLKFVSTSQTSTKGVMYESESQPIQVFSPLRVQPNNITLVIGGTFQVQCTGGPHPQSTIEYSIEDGERASVSTGGRVEGRNTGKTVLVARSIGYDKNGHQVIFSQDSALIHVIYLEGIKIHSPLTRMIAGSEMPVYALGLTDQETPFSFGSASPGIKFKWSVSNNKVVSVRNIYSEVGMDETNENNFCARVKAEEDGVVTLRMDVHVPDNSRSNKILTDEVQIQVFKKLKLLNPKYENGMILLSPNSQLKLKCNRFAPAKVTYRISPVNGKVPAALTVDGQGMLVASSKLETAILTVVSVEEFGITQHLTAIVKVEEISYLMLKPIVDVKTKDWQLMSIPVGFNIPFLVTYHDNLGRTFDATTSLLKFRANRFDLTRIAFGPRNDTLIVEVLKPGFTVLKVWDSQSHVSADYIKIAADFAIDPIDAQVLVGDVICFGSPLLTQEGHAGSWSSESTIVAVHPASGGAIAVATGTTTITYYLSSAYSTSTQVTVLPVDKVTLLAGNLQYITNADPGKSYKVAVLLQSSSYYRINNVVGKNCSAAAHDTFQLPHFNAPFLCDIAFNTSFLDVKATDIFQVDSGFDMANGMYYCRILVADKVHMDEVSTLNVHLVLSVYSLLPGHGMEFEPQHLALPFLPKFSVNDQKLTLTGYQNSVLSVSAVPAIQDCLEVLPSDKGSLEVMMPIKKSNVVSFPIRLIDASQYHPQDKSSLFVDVMCRKTKQSVRVPIYLKMFNIQYDNAAAQCYVPPAHHAVYDWQSYLTVVGIVIATMIFAYVCRVLTISRQGTVTTQPVFLNSSPNGSFNVSPSRLSLSHHSRIPSSPETFYDSTKSSPKLWSIDSPHQPVTNRRSPNIYR